MRARTALIPLALAATLLAGCATKTPTPAITPTPTVAGNGVSALTATEIVAKAKAALSKAKSFHVKGTMIEAGKATKVDVSVVGKDYAGTIEAEGLALELIVIGNDVYIKAPDAFWATQIPASLQPALAGLKGKYVKADATKAEFAPFKTLFSVDEIFSDSGSVTKGTAKTIGGKPAIGVITDSDKSIMYVSTEGEAYPLRVEPGAPSASASASPSASPSAGAGAEGIDFSDFDAATVKAPDAANVFDLKTITG